MLMVFILLINEVNVAGVFSPSVIFFFFCASNKFRKFCNKHLYV